MIAPDLHHVLTEAADTGYLVHDGLRVCYANPCAAALFAGMLDDGCIAADSVLAKSGILDGEGTQRGTLLLENRQGPDREFRYHAYPLSGSNRRCCEFIAVAVGEGDTGVSDRARLEMLARFHDEYPEPMFRLAGDGSVCDANAAARELLAGLAVEGEAGLPGPIGCLVDEVRASGGRLTSNVRLGDRIYCVTLHPAADADCINVYATDVTRLHRSQQAMHQATKMEAVGQLAGSVAHDFNNRLTVILGNLELLEDDCRGEALLLVEEARQAADSSSVLARKLLSIARPQQVDYKATEVNTVVRNLATLLDRCLGGDAQLSLELDAEPQEALLDSAELEDVLLNLTLNAREAMQADGMLMIETDATVLGAEDVSGKPGLKPGEYLVIAVTDTGHGMPAHVRERAFEPFFTTREKQGTGLGLSTVYNLVHKWRGHVSIYSEEGVGTCVRIYVPKAAADGAAEPAHWQTQPSLQPVPIGDNPLAGLRVLLVEDDGRIRQHAGEMLAGLGCVVMTADDADEAEQVLKSPRRIDLLLTDLVLPGERDGLVLAECAVRCRPGLPVLFVSGYTQAALEHHDRYRQVVAGNSPFLAKPYSSASLAQALRRACAPGETAPGRIVRRAG